MLELVPTRINGDGERRIDWGAFVRTGWPMLLAVIGLAFWLGGRMETPEEKQRRIDRAIAPLTNEVRKCEQHRFTAGHAVMQERVAAIERIIDSVDAVEREETEILRQMARTAERTSAHLDRIAELFEHYLDNPGAGPGGPGVGPFR